MCVWRESVRVCRHAPLFYCLAILIILSCVFPQTLEEGKHTVGLYKHTKQKKDAAFEKTHQSRGRAWSALEDSMRTLYSQHSLRPLRIATFNLWNFNNPWQARFVIDMFDLLFYCIVGVCVCVLLLSSCVCSRVYVGCSRILSLCVRPCACCLFVSLLSSSSWVAFPCVFACVWLVGSSLDAHYSPSY